MEPQPPSRDGCITTEETKMNNALRERLIALSPSFLKIRSKMGLGENVGFGFLPEVHNPSGFSSAGALPELKGRSPHKLRYSVHSLLGEEYDDLTDAERSNIVVMPVLKRGKARIVSIYQRDLDGQLDPRLIEAHDSVYHGIIAHELAYMVILENKLPPYVDKLLKERKVSEDEKESGMTDEERRAYLFHNDEAEIEIIASAMGYKENIIAKLQYMTECLKTYNIGPYYDRNRRTPQEIIHELEYRMQQIVKYCK